MNRKHRGLLLAALAAIALIIAAALLSTDPANRGSPDRPDVATGGERVPEALGGEGSAAKDGAGEPLIGDGAGGEYAGLREDLGELLVDVRAADGRRILGAEVLVDGRTVKTDENGEAFFAPIEPAAKYAILAKGPEFYDMPATGYIGVSPGCRSEIRLIIKRGGAVRGKVVDTAGRPLTVEAFVRATGPYFAGTGPEWARIAPGGRFELRGVRPGTVYLHASAEWHAKARSGPVEARAGETTEGVVLTLAPAGRIVGRLVRADTKDPFPGARVNGYCKTGGGNGVTGKDGRFAMNGLIPGSWQIQAYAPEWAMVHRAGIEVAAGVVTDVGTIEMGLGGTVVGTLNAPDGVKLNMLNLWMTRRFPGVAIEDSPGDWIAIQPDGSFKRSGLEAAVWLLRARDRNSNVLAETEVVIREGGETRVDLTVAGGRSEKVARVEGLVLDPDGSATRRANVWLVATDGRGYGFGYGNVTAAGRFVIENVRPGKYRVGASNSGGEGRSEEITVGEGQTVTGVRISLTPLIRIKLHAKHRSGNPAIGVYLNLRGPNGFRRMVYTQNTGSAETMVLPGTLEVHLGLAIQGEPKPIGKIVVKQGGARSFDVTID